MIFFLNPYKKNELKLYLRQGWKAQGDWHEILFHVTSSNELQIRPQKSAKPFAKVYALSGRVYVFRGEEKGPKYK